MRAILSAPGLLISAAVLALTACHKPASGVTAGMPARKAGLWEQTINHDGKPLPMGAVKVCVDAVSDAKSSLLAKVMGVKADCQKSFSRDSDGVYVFSSTCKLGEVATVTSMGTVRGDFTSTYQLHAETDMTGPAAAIMNGRHVIDMQARYLGPCPAGAKGGDATLADGTPLSPKALANLTNSGPTPPKF